MTKVEIRVHSSGQNQTFTRVPLPVEIGRQNMDDRGWLALQDLGDRYRIAVAPRDERGLSREAVLISDSGGTVVVTNSQDKKTYALGGAPLEPGESATVTGRTQLKLMGNVVIEIDPATESTSVPFDDPMMRTVQYSGNLDKGVESGKLGDLLKEESVKNAGQVAVALVRQALDVVRKSAGSDEFFDSAIRNTATMIDLDRAFVLAVDHRGEWTVRAATEKSEKVTPRTEPLSDSPTGGDGQAPAPFDGPRKLISRDANLTFEGSREVLDTLLRTRKPVIYDPANYSGSAGSSLMSLDRAVAAPMLNDVGEVIGALYGDRKGTGDKANKPIGDLEAALLEVIAGAVASGLARQREESLRASMGQFFSPEVTKRLADDENLLAGRDAEVSVLFCDIRGFSAVAEQINPEQTIEWINDVLTELSQCVVANDGVLVDYVGDELLAMWGAPGKQPDHAHRACEAAIEMVRKTEILRKRWENLTPDQFGFGIGINTGTARVGNTGSKLKFKYGPLGNTVNVASRIQGMTKMFGVQILASESTRQSVKGWIESDPSSSTSVSMDVFRYLSKVQPVGIQTAIDIHQISANEEAWGDRCRLYEQALDAFHRCDQADAVRLAGELVHRYPDDAPVVRLLGRIVDAMTDGCQFDPVLRLASK